MASKGIEQSIVPLNRGIVRVPSASAEGELSECINVHPRGGELVNLPRPVEQDLGIALEDGEVLVHVHNHDDITAYITALGGQLYWQQRAGLSNTIADLTSNKHELGYRGFVAGQSRITSLGRCLIIYGKNTPTSVYLWAEDTETHSWNYTSNNVYNQTTYNISARYIGEPISPTCVSNDSPLSSQTTPMDGSRTLGSRKILLAGNNGEENVAVAVGSVQEVTDFGFALMGYTPQQMDGLEEWVRFPGIWSSTGPGGEWVLDPPNQPKNEYGEYTNVRPYILNAQKASSSSLDWITAVFAANAYLGLMHTLQSETAKKGYVYSPMFYRWALVDSNQQAVAYSAPILILPNEPTSLPALGVTAYSRGDEHIYLCPQVSVPAYTCKFNIDLGDLDLDASGLGNYYFKLYVTKQTSMTTLRANNSITKDRLNQGILFDWFLVKRDPSSKIKYARQRIGGYTDIFTTSNSTGYRYITGEVTPPMIEVKSIQMSDIINLLRNSGQTTFTVGAESAGYCDFTFSNSLLENGTPSATTFTSDRVASSLASYLFATAVAYNSRLYFGNYKMSNVSDTLAKFGYIFGNDMTPSSSRSVGDNHYNALLIRYKDGNGASYYKTVSCSIAPRGPIRCVILPQQYAELTLEGQRTAKAHSFRLAHIGNTGEVVRWTSEFTFAFRNATAQYAYTNITAENFRNGSIGNDFASSANPSGDVVTSWMSDSITISNIGDPGGYTMTDYASPNVTLDNVHQLTGAKILEFGVATRPVSQGQFGQHPIMMFTDDGIWGVGIDTSAEHAGELLPAQPVSREVAYPGTILQLDDALSFVSDKGLMLLSGNDAVNVSEVICGHNTDLLKFLEVTELSDIPFHDDKEFREGLRNAQFIYDAANSAIHAVYYSVKDGVQVHYIYDLVNKTWTTQQLDQGDIVSVAKDYPKDIVQIGKKLYSFEYTFDEDNMTDGLVLTKPLPLGDPVGRKMLYDLRCIGQKTSADTKFRVIVFLSNDGRRWWRLRSLKGMSAKFFRLMILTHMTDNDTLSGAVLQYVSRMTNKLR